MGNNRKPKGLARLISVTIDRMYIPLFRKLIPPQTFRYGVCGGLNAALGLFLYYLAIHYVVAKENLDLGIVVLSPHIAALAIIFPINTFNGFWLNRNVAFKHSPLRHRTQAVRYLVSVLGSLAVNYLCLKLFVDLLHIWYTPAQAISIVIVTVYSYLTQKYFSFRGCETV